MTLVEHENIGMFEEYKLFRRNDNLYEVHLLHPEAHKDFKIQVWENIKAANSKRIK